MMRVTLKTHAQLRHAIRKSELPVRKNNFRGIEHGVSRGSVGTGNCGLWRCHYVLAGGFVRGYCSLLSGQLQWLACTSSLGRRETVFPLHRKAKMLETRL